MSSPRGSATLHRIGGNMFSSEADVRIRPDGERVLLTPIGWAEEYEVDDTRIFTAEAGMIHDGASIPALFSFLNGPSVQFAATLHDAAYRKHSWDNGEPMTRREADLIILYAAQVEQGRARERVNGLKAQLLRTTHFMQRWIIFLTLVLLGGSSWRSGPGRDQYDYATLREVETILKALELTEAIVPGSTEAAA